MSEEKINVLVLFSMRQGFSEILLRQIQDVSPRINLTNASALIDGVKSGDVKAKKKIEALLPDSEVIWGFPTMWGIPLQDVLKHTPKLKWAQCPFSGVDSFAVPEFINNNVILTNSSGMHGTQVAETAFLHMIELAKNSPRLFRQQQQKKYEGFIPMILEGKTVGILGLGPIGKHIAKICKGFGMRVIGVEANPNVKCRYCEAIFLSGNIREALSQCDFVIDALPLLDATRKFVGGREFRAMKPTAFFVNIGRGGTVDQDALISALREKRIAGAGLDVYDPEPIPADNPLWEMPNVTISPHIAGQRPDYLDLATALFTKNLKRYVAGKKLFNVVDKKTLSVPGK
jgi:D-2-hydroxyacid dehydrogenase (NADP+)